MPTLCNKQECTGCLSCFAVCKHHAIIITKDIYGFDYPIINASKCVNCGLCEKVCPILNAIRFNDSQKAFACYRKKEEDRLASSSGGIATLLALNIVEGGGAVYGCAFKSPFSVQHVRCTSISEILRLRGSKYVQSNVANIYKDIRRDLKCGNKVLFVGTPCQVAGIKSLFSNSESLYTVDLVCHGVPSMKYLSETLPKHIVNSEKKDIQFRSKSQYHFSIIGKEGDTILYERPICNDLFMKGFFNGVTIRPACHICRFAQKERCSDLTIGDFWGIKSKIIADISKGISLVLINTEKGHLLMDMCQNEICIEERPLSEAFAGNAQLNYPYKKSFRADIFKKIYPIGGYQKALWCALLDKILIMKLKHFIYKSSK